MCWSGWAPCHWPSSPSMKPIASRSGGMTSGRSTGNSISSRRAFPRCRGWPSPRPPIRAPSGISAPACSWSRTRSSWPALIGPTSAIYCATNRVVLRSCWSSWHNTAVNQGSSTPAPATGWTGWPLNSRPPASMRSRITLAWTPNRGGRPCSASAWAAAWSWWPRSPLAWGSTNPMCASWPTSTCPKASRPTTKKPVGRVAMAYLRWPGWPTAPATSPSCAGSSMTPEPVRSRNASNAASSRP